MKKLLTLYLIPLLISLSLVFVLSLQPQLNTFLFPLEAVAVQDTIGGFIPAFSGNENLEKQFLWKSHPDEDVVFVAGSSELQDESGAVPYRFIPAHSGARVQAYGHAGNQCFSVFCQLLAHTERLKGSRIVFILSPGWFEARPAMGTTSTVFLEYVSARFLEKTAASDNPFTAYASKRIAQLFSEFVSPSWPLKTMNFKHRSALSPLHKFVFSPLVYLDKIMMQYYKRIHKTAESEVTAFSPVLLYNTKPYEEALPWDSMFAASRASVLAKATNNTMGIGDDYFNTHIRGKKGHIKAVGFKHNTELQDFRMLMKLIRAYEVEAYFIIQPLNACYYTNLSDLKPAIDEVRKEINGGAGERSYGCADFFVCDTASYDKALLTDVMHFSEYGWYRVNQSIMNHYVLK